MALLPAELQAVVDRLSVALDNDDPRIDELGFDAISELAGSDAYIDQQEAQLLQLVVTSIPSWGDQRLIDVLRQEDIDGIDDQRALELAREGEPTADEVLLCRRAYVRSAITLEHEFAGEGPWWSIYEFTDSDGRQIYFAEVGEGSMLTYRNSYSRPYRTRDEALAWVRAVGYTSPQDVA